jgi:cation transport protein ChaC
MSTSNDPFRHHPGLRGLITDPKQSFFRDFTAEALFESRPELRTAAMFDWVFSDQEREANRNRVLKGRCDMDLWVFAYGSLMWDPAFCFEEVRRAHAPFYSRHFILKDTFGARGSAERPGLMAALDAGAGCNGILFRIARDKIEAETEILWRREMFGAAYIPAFIDVTAGEEQMTALTFVADHKAPFIEPDLTREEQIRYIATGSGFLGTSYEYLANIVEHFRTICIDDPDIEAIYKEVRAYLADR